MASRKTRRQITASSKLPQIKMPVSEVIFTGPTRARAKTCRKPQNDGYTARALQHFSSSSEFLRGMLTN